MFVVGTEAQRAAIERIPGATFLPFSTAQPTTTSVLLLRDMLVNPGFAEAIQNVPENASAALAAAVMGPYYPRTAICPLTTLTSGGPARASPETVETSLKRFRVIFASCRLVEHLFLSVVPAGWIALGSGAAAVIFARRAARREGQAGACLPFLPQGPPRSPGSGAARRAVARRRCASTLEAGGAAPYLRAARPRPRARSASRAWTCGETLTPDPIPLPGHRRDVPMCSRAL
jgi:hypothetical protein